MLIGILQAGHTPDELIERHGEYDDLTVAMINRAGKPFEYKIFSVIDDRFPSTPSDCDAFVITGSKFGAYDLEPWIGKLEAFIRNCYTAKIPLVGICFGHQIIAQAMGAKVEKVAAGWGVGVHDHQLAERPSWLELDSLAVNVIHQDQVLEVPNGAKLVAGSPFCPIAALRYENWALSFQGHPEFNNDFERDLISLRAGDPIPIHRVEEALPQLVPGEKAANADDIAHWIGKFLEEALR